MKIFYKIINVLGNKVLYLYVSFFLYMNFILDYNIYVYFNYSSFLYICNC